MENCITKAFLFALKKREREREKYLKCPPMGKGQALGDSPQIFPSIKSKCVPFLPHPLGLGAQGSSPIPQVGVGGFWGAEPSPGGWSSTCTELQTLLGWWDAGGRDSSCVSGEEGRVPCASSRSPPRRGRLCQHALLILVLSALFSDINGTSEDINYQLTAAIVRGLWDLMIPLVLKKLLWRQQ